MSDVLIAWRSLDGEEREERWSSVERFRWWAQANGLRCTWTAYSPPLSEDDDEEWVLLDQGQV
jgi:hypothetical protein